MTDTTTPEQMSAEELAKIFSIDVRIEDRDEFKRNLSQAITADREATAARVSAEPSGAQWIDLIEDECWDICTQVTGEDSFEWEIRAHYQAAPCVRVIGRSESLRHALTQASKAGNNPPEDCHNDTQPADSAEEVCVWEKWIHTSRGPGFNHKRVYYQPGCKTVHGGVDLTDECPFCSRTIKVSD